ncbi:MBL fold metallo-hydrolase [Gemmatimonadota bacterium]
MLPEEILADVSTLRPGLHLVEAHVEDFDVRGAVVAGRKAVVVWDTLARPEDMVGVEDLASGLPLQIVFSHGDWDHVWGTAGLSGSWETIIAHHECGDRFSSELPLILAEKRKASPGEYDNVQLVPPTHVFRDPQVLDLGGITLELSSFPGHTPDSIVAFIPEWGVLLAGDAVETPLPFLNKGSFLGEWARRLEEWWATLDGWDRGEEYMSQEHRSREVPVGSAAGGVVPGNSPLVIPSHGQTGGAELLLRNARYLRALQEGREPEIPDGLSPFYRETHAANLALAREG